MIFTISNKTDAAAVKSYIDKCKEGIVYSVEIKKKTIRRTLPQNSLYWLYVTCIADETGNDTSTINAESYGTSTINAESWEVGRLRS